MVSDPAASQVLAGRPTELARLADAVDTVIRGRGVVVSITGEPGIGKSALLAVLVGAAEVAGMRVCAGMAEELESRLPFAAVAGCLGIDAASVEPRLAEVARKLRGHLIAGDRAASRRDIEAMVTEALIALVEDWCAAGPVAVVLDDLQWADPASLVVVHLLGRATAQLPLLLVGACRTGILRLDIDALLRSLVGRPGAVDVPLAPLDDDAVIDLTQSIIGLASGPRLRRLVGGCGGNPLYVSELSRAVLHSRQLQVLGGVADIVPKDAPDGAGLELPVTLSAAIRSRLSRLTRRSRDVLRFAALLGATFDLMDLVAVSARPVAAVADAVTEATRAGVLRDAGPSVAFRHDLIRQAILEEMPSAVRAAMHQYAGRALVHVDAPVERVAAHLLAGGTIPVWARSWLLEVAERLTTRAPDVAVELLGRAAAVEGPDRALTGPLTSRLAAALIWSGRFAEAAEAARLALGVNLDPAVELDLRDIIFHSAYYRGYPDVAYQEARVALELPDLTPRQRRKWRYCLALAMISLSELDEGTAVAREVSIAALAEADHRTAVGAFQVLAGAGVIQGQFADALRDAEQGLAIAGHSFIDPHRILGLHVNAAAAAVGLDRLGQAERALALGRSAVERASDSNSAAWYHAVLAVVHFRRGRWDDALAEVAVGLAAGEYDDHQYRISQDGNGLAALIAVRRGELDEARGQLVLATGETTVIRLYEYWVVWARATLAEAEGHPRRALDLLLPFWREGSSVLSRETLHFLVPDIARLVVAAGEPADLRPICDDLQAQVDHGAVPGAQAAALLTAGMATASPDLLAQAVARYQEAGWHIAVGLSQEQLAVAHAQAGDVTAARAALDDALNSYAAVDARWDAARAASALRRRGIARGSRGRRQRPKSGWAALTETEWEVARHVTAGRSNPDIAVRMYLSRRTVQSHVSDILAKLNLNSRVEIATAVARHRPG